jgi:hypothetical protein
MIHSKIVYNVTVKVTTEIANDWRVWMLREHIPEVIATQCFEHANMFRVLDIDDTEGPTFCIQYFTTDMEKYDYYIATYAPELRQKTIEKWGEKALAFRSLMELQS